MHKRTPGRWKWKVTVLDNGDQRVIIVDENGNEIHPTLGDIELLTHAPEMHEMLYEVEDELYMAISYRKATTGIENVSEKVSRLLDEINVKREKTNKEI